VIRGNEAYNGVAASFVNFGVIFQIRCFVAKVMSGSEVLTVEISGISDISEEEIEVHFQKRKYGGGEVNITSLKDGKAIMTIEGITPESKKRYYFMCYIIDNKVLLSMVICTVRERDMAIVSRGQTLLAQALID